MRMVVIGIACVMFVLSAACRADEATPRGNLHFGIDPTGSPVEFMFWLPLIRYMGAKSDLRISFEAAKDTATFDQRLADGAFDIVNAASLRRAIERPPTSGYRVFVRAKSETGRSLLVVRKDSSFKSVADLQGSNLVFSFKAAMAASVVPRAFLEKQGITFEAHYLGTPDSLLRAVREGDSGGRNAAKAITDEALSGIVSGNYAGGGTTEAAFDRQPQSLREQLRVLWSGPELPEFPIAAHQRVPPEVLARLKEVMLAMDGEESGRAALKPLGLRGFMPATDSDLDELRALGMALSDR